MAQENKNEQALDEAYSLQELSECIKWLAETQIFCGSKEDPNIYNGDNASGFTPANKYLTSNLSYRLDEVEKLLEEKQK